MPQNALSGVVMRNSTIRLVAMWSVFAAVIATAQVDIRLEIENTTVLTHEALMARVTVLNQGLAPLTINAADGTGPQLRFNVEHDSGRSAARRQGARPQELAVPAGQARALDVDLTMLYDMTQSDRYFVRALLIGGNVEVRSSLKVIDIVPGLELASASGSVPRAPGVRRIYSLRYWARKQEEHVFLCVHDEPSGRTFSPVYLGTLIRVVRPTMQLGEGGTVTVKHQVNRAQMMVSTLKSRANRLSLLSQRPVRMRSKPLPKAPSLLRN
jgi:hypothetical protein